MCILTRLVCRQMQRHVYDSTYDTQKYEADNKPYTDTCHVDSIRTKRCSNRAPTVADRVPGREDDRLGANKDDE